MAPSGMFHRLTTMLVAALVVSACGGGGGDGGTPATPTTPSTPTTPTTPADPTAPVPPTTPADPATPVTPTPNTPPVPVIASPAATDTFRAGSTVTFSGTATDAEDGTLTGAQLGWYAELHHDTHTHPFVPLTEGGTGSAQIPVRGETSANIFYRFHFIATDRAGARTEVTRDIQPQTAQLTLVTVPPGLPVLLDGQPVTTPLAVTGVVGTERDLGAADQIVGGRRYVFAGWNDGGAATHVISTPVANTQYIATFTDAGPATNAPPTVTLASATPTGTVGAALRLTASPVDADGTVASVEFLSGSTVLGSATASPYIFDWTPATAGAYTLTARVTDNGGAVASSAALAVTIAPASVADTEAPTVALSAPANLASNLSGTLTLSASATDNVGVASVEFQIDGAAIGAADTEAPYSATLDSNAYVSGQHVLRARSRDAAGNVSPWASALVQFGGTRDLSAGFTKNEAWVTGLANATAMAQAPDGRIFIAQQGGALRVVKAGVLLATPFHTFANVDPNGERGLLGIAFHPDFATNGWVYTYHTTTQGGSHNRISRLTANGDVSAAGSETPLIDLPLLSSATNHNGGAIHFGVDRKLYVGVGDNAASARAPDLTQVFGKLLRFNDDGSIPTDNPFYATQAGQARAVWAYGLRNPYTFAVQPGTGRIHINDVGQDTWEEVNLGAPGANYGWPASEGTQNLVAGVTGPLFSYRHTATTPAGSGPGGFLTGFAIAGGAFYPASGGGFPASYAGNYFIADYVSRFVARIDLADGNGGAAYSFARVAGEPVDVMTGQDGALYVLTRSSVTRISAP